VTTSKAPVAEDGARSLCSSLGRYRSLVAVSPAAKPPAARGA